MLSRPCEFRYEILTFTYLYLCKNSKLKSGVQDYFFLYDTFLISRYLYRNEIMKQKKSKRVIVRITENQFKNLVDCVIDEQTTVSDLIRESVIDKLKKLKDDAKRKG